MNPTLKGSHADVEVRPLQGRNVLLSCSGGGAQMLCVFALPPAIVRVPSGDSERLEEAYQLGLLQGRERLIGRAARSGLARVAQYRFVQGERLRAVVRGRARRAAVVHELVVRPKTPERRGANHVLRGLAAVLDEAVARADVVEQEVAERVNDLIRERGGNDERAAVDDRAFGRGRHRARVADRTTERVEERRAGVCRVVLNQSVVAGRGAERTHEARKRLYVLLAVFAAVDARVTGAGLVVRHRVEGRDGAAERRVLTQVEAVRDAHLVQVRVGREREKARVLVLVAEAAEARLVRRFEHVHLNGRAAHGCGLRGAYRDQGQVADGLDEAVAEEVERGAEGSHRLALILRVGGEVAAAVAGGGEQGRVCAVGRDGPDVLACAAVAAEGDGRVVGCPS